MLASQPAYANNAWAALSRTERSPERRGRSGHRDPLTRPDAAGRGRGGPARRAGTPAPDALSPRARGSPDPDDRASAAEAELAEIRSRRGGSGLGPAQAWDVSRSPREASLKHPHRPHSGSASPAATSAPRRRARIRSRDGPGRGEARGDGRVGRVVGAQPNPSPPPRRRPSAGSGQPDALAATGAAPACKPKRTAPCRRSPLASTASRLGRSGSEACCQRPATGSPERLELAPPCFEGHLLLCRKLRAVDRAPQQFQHTRLGELAAPVCREDLSAIQRRHARRVELSDPTPEGPAAAPDAHRASPAARPPPPRTPRRSKGDPAQPS